MIEILLLIMRPAAVTFSSILLGVLLLLHPVHSAIGRLASEWVFKIMRKGEFLKLCKDSGLSFCVLSAGKLIALLIQ
jgi:hypothetical protein